MGSAPTATTSSRSWRGSSCRRRSPSGSCSPTRRAGPQGARARPPDHPARSRAAAPGQAHRPGVWCDVARVPDGTLGVRRGGRRPLRVAFRGARRERRGEMRARTVGELRASGWQAKSVKQELRDNLVARLRRGEPLFPGIVGYEESVVPQIENAILSGQDLVFLGERGQANTRMSRLLPTLLDEAVPALAVCQINDDPFAPIRGACRARPAAQGAAAEIVWIPRDRRYGEKVATPGLTIADLIGEGHPIKVADGR